jgi:cysteinyl-tRNA synthetase
MLGGSLTVDGVKMSKSLGNFTRARDALENYRPQVIRMFAMSAHYASPVDYSETGMQAAQAGWERLYGAVRLTRSMLGSAPASDDGNSFRDRLAAARSQFIEVMDDDFNMPKAVAVLQELTRDVNTLLNSGQAVGRPVLEAIESTYADLGGTVLGIIPAGEVASAGDSAREAGLIQLLIDMRTAARKAKKFKESDRIRDELAKLGVVLEDRADGTIWRTG